MFVEIIKFLTNNTPLLYLTQSIWRDEGFSYFMAKPNIIQVVINSFNDFNPPFYYLLLHFWMKIFGENDISLRILSFIFYLLTIYFAYLLAKKLFSEKFALYVAFFTLLNPMLMYYAFEIRMYSLFAFLTLSSVYFFIGKNRRWYIVSTVLGLYTHSFFILVIFSELLYLYLSKKWKRINLREVIIPLILFLPWLPILIWQFKESANSWIFPVDGQLILSALGNLFTNYEGTPGNLWNLTAIISIIILSFCILSFKKQRQHFLLFGSLIFFPLFLIIGYSIIRRPIYVNRYLIFITIGEIFAITSGIWSIKNKKTQTVICYLWIAALVGLDFLAVNFHRKTDIRSKILEISKLASKNDLVYTKTPLIYFESAFYYPDRNKVYVYNPANIAIPKYIGTSVIPRDRSKMNFPLYPVNTYLIYENGDYVLVVNKPL